MFLSGPPPYDAQYRNKIYLPICINSYIPEKGGGGGRKKGGVSNLYPGEMKEDSDMSYRYQEGFRAVVVSM